MTNPEKRNLATELIGSTVAQLWAGDSALAFRLVPTCDRIVALEKRIDDGDPSALDEAEDIVLRPIAVFDLFGECCSETWLADVVNIDALRGEVLRVEAVELPEGHLTDQSRTRQDEDQVMGWEIYTTIGVCTLAVRNSSNGYYGGSVKFVRRDAEPFRISWISWIIEITVDYSA